jgi:hypothetical protein
MLGPIFRRAVEAPAAAPTTAPEPAAAVPAPRAEPLVSGATLQEALPEIRVDPARIPAPESLAERESR